MVVKRLLTYPLDISTLPEMAGFFIALNVGNSSGEMIFRRKKRTEEKPSILTLSNGERSGIRTHGLWLRRPTLYPAELPAHLRSNIII